MILDWNWTIMKQITAIIIILTPCLLHFMQQVEPPVLSFSGFFLVSFRKEYHLSWNISKRLWFSFHQKPVLKCNQTEKVLQKIFTRTNFTPVFVRHAPWHIHICHKSIYWVNMGMLYLSGKALMCAENCCESRDFVISRTKVPLNWMPRKGQCMSKGD